MDFAYEKQENTAKLVYTISLEDDIDFASMNQLIDSNVPGFVPMEFAMKGGAGLIKYDISNTITAREFFSACVNKKDVLVFLNGITKAFLSAEDRSINEKNIVLDLNYIFMDQATHEPQIIVSPVPLKDHNSDRRRFLRQFVCGILFDQTENSDYIAKIINYFNDPSAFSLTGFKMLLHSIESQIPTPVKEGSGMATASETIPVDGQLYGILRNGLEQKRSRIDCPPVSAERINQVLHQILLDHPQMCHFEGEWYWDNGVAPVYTLEDAQRAQLTSQVEHTLRMMRMDPLSSDLEKAAVVYRWLAEHVTYDRTAVHNQSAYGALVDGRAVCKGIAKAYQLLLKRLGIVCELVEGSLDGIMKHVWVRYCADGIWYHSDITMAYPQFYHIAMLGGMNYMAVSAQQIQRTHTIWDADKGLQQTKEGFFQSLQNQRDTPHNPLTDVPKSLRGFLSGQAQFLAAGSVSDVYRFGSRVLKRVFCGEDLSKLYYAMRECAMLQRVSNCPGITQLYGWDVCRERDGYVVYLVLQYGQPLEEYCSQVRPSPQNAVALIRSACVALEGCYAAGVAHLDVQPGNLVLSEFDRSVQLTDFSSAVPVEEVAKLEQLRGTPAYVAPEIYHYRAYSQAADVYSLGIMLYCLLSNGKLPYGDQDPPHEAVRKRMNGYPVSLTAHVNNTLRLCVEKACSFHPSDRYPDLHSFRMALEDVQHTLHQIGTSSFAAPYRSMQENMSPFVPNTPRNPTASSFVPRGMGHNTQNAPAFCADTIGETTVLGAPPSQQDETATRVDKVQFSAVAPKKAVKGEYTLVQLFMYEQEFRSAVEEALQMGESPMQEKKSGIYQVRDKTMVKVVLSSRDIEITENIAEEPWNGGYLCFDFALDIPQNCTKRQILLNAAVYFDGVPATRLLMTLQLQTQYEQRLQVMRNDVLSAFVSYASQDRARVASLIQGMKKARPEMDVFFDVSSLRSGENWEEVLRLEVERRDVLFLCWSHNAKVSPWVDMEWRYALENKGIEAIEPIPIDPPDICPPPVELQSKHFNDNLLYIINK